MHDEPAVDGMPAAVEVVDVMRVCVTAQSGLRLEQRDFMGAREQVGRGEPGDTRSDHRDRGPVSRVGAGWAAHVCPLSSKVCLTLTLGGRSGLVKSLSNVC